MTAFYKPRPERWPQFSLRGLFVLLMLLGASLAWLGREMSIVRARTALRQELEANGADLCCWPAMMRTNAHLALLQRGDFERPSDLRRVLGDEKITMLYLRKSCPKSQIAAAKRLCPAAEISVILGGEWDTSTYEE